MAITIKKGKLYCTACKRDCDSTCWNSCAKYRVCNTCKYLREESEYCDDCSIEDNDKWVDAYEHE